MRLLVCTLAFLFVTAPAEAQLRDLIKKGERLLGRKEVKQGLEMAQAMTRDLTEEEEIEIGRIISASILATYPLSSDDALQRYVTLVGNTVAMYSERPNLEWHFAVLETSMVNAYSAPGGYIFITTGALAQIRSEAELAAVLGHEIAHATEKHILDEIKRAEIWSTGGEIADERLGSLGLTDERARKVGEIGRGRLFENGIGRREELEADRIGVTVAAAAGYHPAGLMLFLESLSRLSGGEDSIIEQLTSTHPRPEDRIQAITRYSNGDGVLLADRWERWTLR